MDYESLDHMGALNVTIKKHSFPQWNYSLMFLLSNLHQLEAVKVMA